MAAPKVATGRIILPVDFSGHLSHFHAYVRNIQTGGSTYKINSRATDSNDLNWEDAAEAFYNSMTYIWAAGFTPGDLSLQQLTGGIWVPISFYTPVASNASGAGQPATQVTMTLRDKLFYKVKVVALNTNQAPPQHWVSATGGNAAMDNWAKQWLSTYTVTHAPYNWQVGVSNQYLNTSPFVAITVTLNRKQRKLWGFL